MKYACNGCSFNCTHESEAGPAPVRCACYFQGMRARWRPYVEPILMITVESEPTLSELFIRACQSGAHGDWGPLPELGFGGPAHSDWERFVETARCIDDNGQVWRLEYDCAGLWRVPVDA